MSKQWMTYAEYRDSGAEWLGTIPKEWDTEEAHWLFTEIDVRSKTGEEELLSVSHITGVTARSEKDVNMFMAETLEDYKTCKAGDLVINTLWAWMGAMGVAFRDGIVSPAYNVYRPSNRIEPRYLDYLVRLPIFAQEVTRYSKGVWSSRLRLYPQEFFGVILPVPSITEQRSIADFLDQEVKKIDDLIRKEHRLLELLIEKRQALVNHIVTQGLTANVKVQHSEKNWSSEIPDTWELKQLRYLADVRVSGVDKKTEEGEILVSLCNYTDVYNHDVITSNLEFMQATASMNEIIRFELKADDVVITKDSESWDDIAVPSYVPKDLPNVICGYHLALIRPSDISGRFLFWAFSSKAVAYQANIAASGITRFGLPLQAIKNTIIPVPSEIEQQQIAEYLENQVQKITLLGQKIQTAIECLQERRVSLITAAVTGQIKVTG